MQICAHWMTAIHMSKNSVWVSASMPFNMAKSCDSRPIEKAQAVIRAWSLKGAWKGAYRLAGNYYNDDLDHCAVM